MGVIGRCENGLNKMQQTHRFAVSGVLFICASRKTIPPLLLILAFIILSSSLSLTLVSQFKSSQMHYPLFIFIRVPQQCSDCYDI
jgi:hypothetical protein